MKTASSFCLVLVTIGTEKDALRISRVLVKNRLAACVNIIPLIRSVYSWRGKLKNEREWLLLIKARRKSLEKLESAVRDHHPYDVPEILALPLFLGSGTYLRWLFEQTKE